jgi:hypothetical protein
VQWIRTLQRRLDAAAWRTRAQPAFAYYEACSCLAALQLAGFAIPAAGVPARIPAGVPAGAMRADIVRMAQNAMAIQHGCRPGLPLGERRLLQQLAVLDIWWRHCTAVRFGIGARVALRLVLVVAVLLAPMYALCALVTSARDVLPWLLVLLGLLLSIVAAAPTLPCATVRCRIPPLRRIRRQMRACGLDVRLVWDRRRLRVERARLTAALQAIAHDHHPAGGK